MILLLFLTGGFDLGGDPGVGELDAGLEIETGFPADGIDAVVAEIAGLDLDGTGNGFDDDLFACHFSHGRGDP